MSSRPPLVVRALTLEDVEREIGATNVTGEDLPQALTGFRAIDGASALALFRGADCAWLAAFARVELSALGQRVVRGAAIGPLRATATQGNDMESVEEAYRVILDHVMFTSPSPNVISLRVEDEQDRRIDVLYRLALATDARAIIRTEADGARVDIVRSGRRAALAALLSSDWRGTAAGLTIPNLASLRRRRAGSQMLLVLARDLQNAVAAIEPSIAVQYE